MADAAPSLECKTRGIVAPAWFPISLPVSRPISLLKWWHLFSLDAPTVAALWSWFFLRIAHVDAPLFSSLLLALGTWLIYVADRILDGFAPRDRRFLRERHFFYIRYRAAFTIAAAALAGVLAWLVLTRMSATARREDALLFLLALLYFFLVHIPKHWTKQFSRRSRPKEQSGLPSSPEEGQYALLSKVHDSRRIDLESWLPKELAVGVIFAAATAVPAWSRMSSGHARLLPAMALFAALCWLNCVAIERWENPQFPHESAAPQHMTTVWAARHLRRIALCIACLSALLAIISTGHPSSTTAPYLACLLAACLFLLLDCFREHMSAMQLRVAADAALLTPLLFLILH